MDSFIQSCNKHSYFQDLYASHKLGTEGAQAMNPGPFLAGMDTNMSTKAFSAVEDALPPEVCLGALGARGLVKGYLGKEWREIDT